MLTPRTKSLRSSFNSLMTASLQLFVPNIYKNLCELRWGETLAGKEMRAESEDAGLTKQRRRSWLTKEEQQRR